MKHLHLAASLVLMIPLLSQGHVGAVEPAKAAEPEINLAIGGVGGVYFLAEPGDLVIDLAKRDRHRSSAPTELRAVLAGPDRRVLQEVTIPDDGSTERDKLGPLQRTRLSTRVERKGVYALNITVSQDRYGENIVWGFRTNCPHWLIETSRGHRDRVHEEPIVLLQPDRPGNVCFLPRPRQFAVEITGLPRGTDAVQVFDGGDRLIESLKVARDGKASHTFPADVRRDGHPWRLLLPKHQATIEIDGVTRWNSDDPYPDSALWTPEPSSFFPLAEYRWLLTPYSRTIYGKSGKNGQISLAVHNNSPVEKTIQLALEFPEAPWPLDLSSTKLVVPARRTQEVTLRYKFPSQGQTQVCHLRATPQANPEFSTYSTVTIKSGPAPASQPLEIPLVLKPYAHENEQFGYLPDYPLESQVYFDLKNRPCFRRDSRISMLRDGEWPTTELPAAITSQDSSLGGRSFGTPSAKIAWDRDGDLYTLASIGRRMYLLHSSDAGKTFAACLIPGREDQPAAFDLEQFSGQNPLDGPPPILRYTQTARDPKLIWRRLHDLELFCPKKVNGRIVISEPVLLSKKCIGLSTHSGIPSCVVSRGGKVHVVWGEATDPNEKVPGLPTYVASYDRGTGTVGKPALVAYGPPANDVHNTPSITIDSRGYLHVLAGTHGAPFPYAQSLQPNDAHAGWTEAVTLGKNVNQTYIGLVCGPNDTLYAAFRLWKRGEAPFPNSLHATLAVQRKPAGKPWEEPRVLIVPPFSEYSVYRHCLTIDRVGRLFLSYDYWSTFWFYRNDHPGSRRALIFTPDGGATWKLAETADLALGVPETKP